MRLFTRAEWAAMSEQQREVIRRQRMAYIAHLAAEHDARYHAAEHRAELQAELAALPDAR